MSNTTDIKLYTTSSIITVIEGFALFLIEFSMAAFILSRKRLRSQKEFILYFGIMIYDSLLGFSFAMTSIIILVPSLNYTGMVSLWTCYNSIVNYIFIFTIPGVGLISFMGAVDRFISIFYPLKYLCFGTMYSIWLILSPIILMVPIFVVGGIEAYIARDIYFSYDCNFVSGSVTSILFYLRYIRIGATVAAVFLYAIIFIKIYKVFRPAQFKTNNQQKNMIRATITVGLLVLNELIFIIFPDIYLYLDPQTSLAGIFYLMVLSKGVMNIILVLIMQKELRFEISRVFKKFTKVQPI